MVTKTKGKTKQTGKREIPLLREEIFWPEDDGRWEGTSGDTALFRGDGGHYKPEDKGLIYSIGEGSNKRGRSLNLGRDSYIWCFAGPRGAGKTSLMSYIAEQCAYLYDKRIISNYPIKLQVWSEKAKRIIDIESEPLELGKLLMFDQSYCGAIIVIDEAPQIINRLATMTWKNRLLDLWLQQIRKNNNSLLYASQNEFWVDNELRWQTDIITNCRDASIINSDHQKGSVILTQTRDMSGLWTGYSYDEKPRIIKKQRHITKLIWGTFDTLHKNDVFASLAKVKMNVGEIQVGEDGVEKEEYMTQAVPLIQRCIDCDIIKKREFTQTISNMGVLAKNELYTRMRDCGLEDYGHQRDSLKFTNFSMDKFLKWEKPKTRR